MDDERTVRIFDRVLQLTRARKLEWAPAQSGFESSFQAARIRSRSVDDDGLAPFAFEIFLPDRNEALAELRSTPTPGISFNTRDEQARRSQNERLEQLYRLARRNALGVDDALDRLEQELDLQSESDPEP
jgi:hypothetical protein